MKIKELEVIDITVGKSEQSVEAGDILIMHYDGRLENGKEFDSSRTRAQPFQFQIGRNSVIQGWEQGIIGMKVGGKRRLTIPPELGYGSGGAGDIPPNSVLIFDVELLQALRPLK